MMMAISNGAFVGSKPLRMGVAEKLKSVLIRPLRCCEKFFRPSSQRHLSRFEGGIPRIVNDAKAGPAFYRIDNPIEIHAAPAVTAADWRRAVERELSQPFSTFPGPLMRATALWASDGTSIILTFHHAMMDALSGTRILHDVMRALAGDCLEVLPSLPPVEEMIASLASNSVVEEGGSRADISSKARAQAAQAPDCQIASKCDPLFAAKNDPFDGAETGGAEPHIAEQSRSWRAASGERAVMLGS